MRLDSLGAVAILLFITVIQATNIRKIRGSLVYDQASTAITPLENVEAKPIQFDPDRCVKDWTSLKSAIVLSAVLNPGSAHDFTLCPGKVFLLDSMDSSDGELQPIDIKVANSVFRCGDDGNPDNNCLIIGGYAHFKMVGSVTDVSFLGITFSGARLSSILATGESDADVQFVDCAWIDNDGYSAILIYNEEKGVPITPNTQIVDLVEPREKSMIVSCDRCIFSKNNLKNSTIVNLSGELIFRESVIVADNVYGGVIISRYTSTLSIENSCFLRNSAQRAGIAVVDERSIVSNNKDTFGGENKVALGSCSEVFYEVGDSCVDGDNPKCVGLCGFFTATKGCPIDLKKVGSISDIIQEMYPTKPGTGNNKGGRNSTENKIFGLDAVPVLVGGGVASLILVICCLGCSFKFGQKSVFAKYAAIPVHDDNQNNHGNNDSSGPQNPVVATIPQAPASRPVSLLPEQIYPENFDDDNPHQAEDSSIQATNQNHVTFITADNSGSCTEQENQPRPPNRKKEENWMPTFSRKSSSADDAVYFAEPSNRQLTKKKGNDSDESDGTDGACLKKKKKYSTGVGAGTKKTDAKKNENGPKVETKESYEDCSDDANIRSSSKAKKHRDRKVNEIHNRNESDKEEVDSQRSSTKNVRRKKKKERNADKSDSDEDDHDDDHDDPKSSKAKIPKNGKKKDKAIQSDTDEDDDNNNVDVDDDDNGEYDSSHRSSLRSSKVVKDSRDRRKKDKRKKERTGHSDADEDCDDGMHRSSLASSKSKPSCGRREKEKNSYSDTDEDNRGGAHRSSLKAKTYRDSRNRKNEKDYSDSDSDSNSDSDEEDIHRSSLKTKSRHRKKKKKARTDTEDEDDDAHRQKRTSKEMKKKKARTETEDEDDDAHRKKKTSKETKKKKTHTDTDDEDDDTHRKTKTSKEIKKKKAHTDTEDEGDGIHRKTKKKKKKKAQSEMEEDSAYHSSSQKPKKQRRVGTDTEDDAHQSSSSKDRTSSGNKKDERRKKSSGNDNEDTSDHRSSKKRRSLINGKMGRHKGTDSESDNHSPELRDSYSHDTEESDDISSSSLSKIMNSIRNSNHTSKSEKKPKHEGNTANGDSHSDRQQRIRRVLNECDTAESNIKTYESGHDLSSKGDGDRSGKELQVESETESDKVSQRIDDSNTSRRSSISSTESTHQSKRSSLGSNLSDTTGTSTQSNEVDQSQRNGSQSASGRMSKRNSIDCARVKEKRNSMGSLIQTYASGTESDSKVSGDECRKSKPKLGDDPKRKKQESDGERKDSRGRATCSDTPMTPKRHTNDGTCKRHPPEKTPKDRSKSKAATEKEKSSDRAKSSSTTSERKSNEKKSSKGSERRSTSADEKEKSSDRTKSSSTSEKSSKGSESPGAGKRSTETTKKSSKEKKSATDTSSKPTRPARHSQSLYNRLDNDAAMERTLGREKLFHSKSSENLLKKKVLKDKARQKSLTKGIERFPQKKGEKRHTPLNKSKLKPFSLRDLKPT